MARSYPLRKHEAVLLAVVMLVALAVAWLRLQGPNQPAEDAAMLMRYSSHLAQGQGIVWNVGEKPVDGATDFLFMALVAGLNALGVPLEGAVLGLGLVAHLLTVALVFWTVTWIEPKDIRLAGLSALLLAVGPGTAYTAVYFGTTTFALAGALTWHLAARLARVEVPPRALTLGFAAASLLTGLIRPEGVFLAGFILLGLLVRREWRGWRAIARDFGLVFGGLGLVYFTWRWAYFGYPLPNPFYKKGAGLLHPDALVNALRNFVALNQPYAWLVIGALGVLLVKWLPSLRGARVKLGLNFVKTRLALLLGGAAAGLGVLLGLLRRSQPQEGMILGLYSQKYFILLAGGALAAALLLALGLTARRWLPAKLSLPWFSSRLEGKARAWALRAGFVLLPAVGFTAIWVLLSNEMNYLGRFQYPLVVLLMMGAPLLWAEVESWLVRWKGWAARVVLALAAVGGLALTILQSAAPVYADGRYDVGIYLRQYAARGYTIATSEAGLLPFYSTWRAVDTWGLNDQWITHTGEVTEAYLERYQPELIVFHANLQFTEKDPETAWDWMARKLWRYAQARGYQLAAAFGSEQDDYHYYYVKSGFEDAQAIITHLRQMDYPWYENGQLAENFAPQQP